MIYLYRFLMKSRKQIMIGILIIFSCLFQCLIAQQTGDSQQKQIQVDQITILKQTKAPITYELTVPDDKRPEKERWWLFLELEPTQNQQMLGTPNQIVFKVRDANGKQINTKTCKIDEDWDSCFLTQDNYNPIKDKLEFQITCDRECQFQIYAHFDNAYKIPLNKNVIMHFEDTPYTQVFYIQINREDMDYDEINLILQPMGWLKYPEPINLYLNFGNQIPTHDKHDYKGMHIWNDGQGIFIEATELREKKVDKLMLIVEGPEKNILILNAKTRKSSEAAELHDYLPFFDYVKADAIRKYTFTNEDSEMSYNFAISTFSGAIKEVVFRNKGKDNQILPVAQPVGKYGQISYHFSKQYIKKYGLSEIGIEIKGKKNSTYIIEVWGTQQEIIPLFHHISKASVMQPKQIDQYLIRVNEYIEKDKQKKSSKVEIILNNIKGKLVASFYSCTNFFLKNQTCAISKEQINDLQKYKNKYQQLIPIKAEGDDKLRRYWFDVDWKTFAEIQKEDNFEKTVLKIVVVIENINEEQTNYQIMYKNKERMHYLIEGDLVINRNNINEKKFFELSFNDPDISEVRVHLTRISGQLKMVGTFQDPRNDKYFNEVSPQNNMLHFKMPAGQSTHSIYVEIFGVTDCLYSLMTQVIRKSESDMDKDNDKGYNQMVILDSIPYQFILAPQQRIILQIRASSQKFTMHMKNSLPIDICGTENLLKPPFKPNCEVHQKQVLKIDDTVTLDKGLVANIGLHNKNDKNVSCKLQISKEQALCQLAPFGHIMSKSVNSKGADRDGDSFHCLSYYIHEAKALQITVKFDNGVYTNESILIKFPDESIQMIDAVHHFSKQEVKTICGKQFEGKSLNYCYMEVQISNISSTQVHVLVQFTDSVMKLMDGFAHSVQSTMIKNEPKIFYYQIFNFENTTLFLENRAGEYKMFISIVDNQQFQKAIMDRNNEIYPNKDNKDFESSNPFYYLEQTLTISAEDMRKKCSSKSPMNCVILISVTIDGNTEQVIENGKFVIECTQQNRFIESGTAVQGYLSKRSVAFYTYQNTVDNGTIIVTVNNQHMKCLNIYINQGTDRPTMSSNNKSTKSDNVLALDHSQLDIYSVTLEANDNCPYTLQIRSSPDELKKIKKGLFSDIQLAKDQIQYLFYENYINETFKILSMHQKGEVTIKVKPMKEEDLGSTDLSKIKGYVWENKDSVRVDNIKSSGDPNPYYCYNCVYLIRIQAVRETQASIIIPTPDVQIPLTTNAMMKDILQQSQMTIYRIFTDSEAKFEIHVQYGEVKITIIDSENNQTAFEKKYRQNKAPITESFGFKKTTDYDFLRYSRIKIQAVTESYFSFGIVSSEDPNKRGQQLKYGIPYYKYLEKGKEECVQANIQKPDDDFVFSFQGNKQLSLNSTIIILKKDGKQINMQKNTGKQQLILSFPPFWKPEAGEYKLCMQNNEGSISVTIIQSSPIIYFPPNLAVFVRDEANMTFGSKGSNIIEINQCSGKMITGIYSQFNSLKAASSEVKQRRRRNNVVQFYYYGPVFINFRVNTGTVRWFPYDQQEGIGTGYDQFETGWLRIKKQENFIQLSAQPIKPSVNHKQNSTIKATKYTAYAARQQQQLYSAMNCQIGTYIEKNLTVDSPNSQAITFSFSIPQQLLTQFKFNDYFLVGLKAEVAIESKNGLENYRFYYPYQQINQAMLHDDDNQWIDEGGDIIDGETQSLTMTILFFIVFVITFGFFVRLCFVKCLRPYLRRRRLVNENSGTQLRYTDFNSTH